jgi:2-C-methyl-D-erythritol 4-phosphate cytidylyltransferase
VEKGCEITDDCSAVEMLGMRVRMVEGDEKNIKITTPMDLKIAEMLLEEMQ